MPARGGVGAASACRAANPHSQKDWESIKKKLKRKTLQLERTKPMFEELLNDEHIWVCLPNNNFYIQHCHRILESIPKSNRFKIGITVCPNTRYYIAHYAYSKLRSQQRDHVKYDKMVVIYTHASRDVISMMEHALIVHCHSNMPHRCANRKIDCDNHIRFDESCSSSDEHSPGPHSLYITYGPPL
jgi:hypothetical protein